MPVELEVAVTRSRKYLARAVFEEPARVTLGRLPAATLRFEDPGVPDLHELFRMSGEGAGLRIRLDMHVEIAQDGRMITTDSLPAAGLAVTDGGGLCIPLTDGLKGLVRFGDLGLLFKVQKARGRPVRRVATPVCAACTVDLKHVVSGGGALSPCAACGSLNEVREDSEEHERSEPGASGPASLLIRPFDDLSSDVVSAPDGIELASGAELPTFDAIEVLRASELPTFDSIEAAKPAMPLEQGLGSLRSKGADLPTFDAISVVRNQGLTTKAAISVLKGETRSDVPPRAVVQLAPPVAPASGPADPRDAEKGATAATGTPPGVENSEASEPDLFSEEFSEMTGGGARRPPKRSELAARGVSLPRVNAVSVPSAPSTGNLPAVGQEDDFLMGRTDLDPSELVTEPAASGLWLYGVGVVSGLIGVVLIVIRLLS